MSGAAGRRWKYGLIGAGRFGSFWLQSFQEHPLAQPVAVMDHRMETAAAVAQEFGLKAYDTVEALLAVPEVELVIVSTPPSTHHPLALQALRAGKHVICEKPLAMNTQQADELLAEARGRGLLLAVDHMLRYSALLDTVTKVVRSGLFGRPLHFFFENYAKDEDLLPEHWFWDRSISGGIFVEHAVHFFDLQRWWFGPGKVVGAHVERRPGTDMIDQVGCAMQHDGALGHQFHSFTQPCILDRADHRLLFAHGDLTVKGWIPLELEIHGILDEAQQERLAALCEGCEMGLVERFEGDGLVCTGRGREYPVTSRIAVRRQLPETEREEIYSQMVRDFLTDQLQSLEDPSHRPRLTAEDAREAVAMGEAATELAEGERPWERRRPACL